MVGEVMGLRAESITVVTLNEHGIKLNVYVYTHKFTCITTCSQPSILSFFIRWWLMQRITKFKGWRISDC